MALIKSDRVKETSTSTGNGTFSLAGAATGYRTFASVCVVGDTFFYGISNQTSGEWETGLGTYSATNTLTRTTVHASSNSGAIVTFGAGTKEVFLTASARYLERIVDNELFTSVGSSTSVVAVNDGPQPQLDLAFSADKTLTARYGPTPSFSRASTGRYTNSSGVLTSAAVNEPRFDHVLENGVWVSKGLLIEEQRTNFRKDSNTLSSSFSTGPAQLSSAAIASPDATLNAWKFFEAPSASGSVLQRLYDPAFVYSGSQSTFSIFAKAGERKRLGVFLNVNPGAYGSWFDLTTGSSGNDSSYTGATQYMTNIGNGWYRCNMVVPSGNPVTNAMQLYVLEDNSTNLTSSSRIGDGTSGLYLAFAQFETGSFPTSYIPTTTAAVTRSADVCQITGGDFSGFWNATEGTFVAEWDFIKTTGGTPFTALSTTSSLIQIYRSGTPDLRWFVYNGTTQADFTIGNVASVNRAAVAYKANDFAGSSLGGVVATDTSGSVPTANKLNILADENNAVVTGHIARLRYFNTRLANQTLVQLSGGINNLVYKSITGSGNATVANNYTNINVSVPNPLPVANGGTGAQTQLAAVTNLISNPPNDGGQYTLASKKTSGTPLFYWVDSTGYAPTLDLLFAADKSLTAYTGPTPSYSRASTGTYFNASGVLTTAAVNAPRFNHVYNGSSWVSKGLLVEEQRTNNLRQSNSFSTTWVLLDGAVVANSGTSPDGTNNAWKMNELATTTHAHGIYQTLTIPGGACTWSIYAKAGERSWLQFLSYNSTTNFPTWFNLSNGTVGTNAAGNTATITPVGNGWYRCSITRSAGADYAQFYTANGDNNGSYLGEVGKGIYIYGAQIETGAFPTSYIPTTTAAVTRSADVCQITGTDFSGFWNASEGSLVYEADSSSNVIGNHFVFLVSDGTFNNQYQSSRSQNNAYTDVGFWVKNGNVWQALINTSAGAWLQGATSKDAMAYKVDDFAFSDDGSAVLTDASGTLPTVNRMEIGGSSLISAALNGHIARLRYYPVRIPNATLQVLST
jgi:hypothetical protein